MIPLPPERAWNVAKRFAPVIHQQFEGYKDLITPIHLGEYIPNLQPVVYYSAKESKDWLAINYNIFHRYDWSAHDKFGGYIRNRLDSHNFDFEGCVILLGKVSNFLWPKYLITQAHYELTLTKYPKTHDGRVIISIESQGHAIRPHGIEGNTLQYSHYKLQNMDSKRFLRWQRASLRRIFNVNGVDMPDQVNDWQVRRRRGRRTDGLIYRNPVRLLELL